MKKYTEKYTETKSSISYLRYHIVICPRYKRKIFKIEGVKERFTELTTEECARNGIEILSIHIGINYVHLYLNLSHIIDIPELVRGIRIATNCIKEEFVELRSMSSLWTRRYFVSTEKSISEDTIQWFLSLQKHRL